MKILNVFPAYESAWAFGGVVRCTSNLCRAMAAMGADVSVYTTNVDGQGGVLPVSVGSPIDVGGVRVTYFPSTFGKNSVWDSRALTRSLDKTIADFDIVYVSAIWQWIGIDTARICYKSGVPMIIGLHGSFARNLRSKGYWKKLLFRQLALRQAVRKASAIHITAELERFEARDWMEGRPSFVVPNAIDPSIFYPAFEMREKFRVQHGVPLDAPTIIVVTRPDWKKRVDLLIKAIVNTPKWYLLVVGPDDAGMALKWKQLASNLGVEDRVIWAGYFAGDALLAAYSASDLFALISHDENFGMVVVEALLCGLPVLVSPEVGVWEMLADSDIGKSVPMNADMIVNELNDFTTNTGQWKDRAKKARMVAKARFSPERVAALMVIAFEDVLMGKRSDECKWSNAINLVYI